MSDWFTIDVVLSTLIVTSFTCIGLIALWGATSTRHWFIRFAVNFAAIGPLLLVPAYEPFVAFTIQSLVVALGIAVYRKRIPERRFSLSSVLLAMLVIAIAVVVAIRLPRLNLQAWLSVVMIGGGAGIATLIGAWWLNSPRKELAWSLGLLGCVVTSVTLSMFDWFIPSIVDLPAWPPEPPVPGFYETKRPVIAWFFIPPITALAVALFLFLWCPALKIIAATSLGAIVPQPQRVRRVFAIGGIFLIAALWAALPLYVLDKLLTPDPIPVSIVPNPNGRDELVAASRIAETTLFNGTLDVETATAQQLLPEVKKCAKAFDMVASGLQKPCAAVIDYTDSDALPFDDFMTFRDMGRALVGRGKLAEFENRFGDAAESYQQAIKLGYCVRRGGLLIDALVGIACSRSGSIPLYFIRDKLSPDQVEQLISQLIQLDASDEEYAGVEQRDRLWSQHATGWHGHFNQILSELVDHTYELFFFNIDDFPVSYATQQATVRLLIGELALAQFHQENSRWPTSLDELVPKYLPAVPIDPFSSDNAALKYRPADDGYVLYSIAANRGDDGGSPPVTDDFMGIPKTGDLRLDTFFAPDEETTALSGALDTSASSDNGEPN
jgi:hypothetical protein